MDLNLYSFELNQLASLSETNLCQIFCGGVSSWSSASWPFCNSFFLLPLVLCEAKWGKKWFSSEQVIIVTKLKIPHIESLLQISEVIIFIFNVMPWWIRFVYTLYHMLYSFFDESNKILENFFFCKYILIALAAAYCTDVYSFIVIFLYL